MRFIAHVTDVFEGLHRLIVDAVDKKTAVANAFAAVPKSVTVSIRREEAPHTVAGELAEERRAP